MSTVLVIALIAAAVLGVMAIAFITAPDGWEDSDGFHQGRQP